MSTFVKLQLCDQQLQGIRLIVAKLEAEAIDSISVEVGEVHCIRGALDEMRWALKAAGLWQVPTATEMNRISRKYLEASS